MVCVAPDVTVMVFVDVEPTVVLLPKSRVVEPSVSWLPVVVVDVPMTPVLPHPTTTRAAIAATNRRSLREPFELPTSLPPSPLACYS